MSSSWRSTTTIVLVAIALFLAILVGVLIPLGSGSLPGQEVERWTPSPSDTLTPTPSPTYPADQRATEVRRTAVATGILPPIRTLTPATPTATRESETVTPRPAPTQELSTQTSTPTAEIETPAGPLIATVRDEPLMLRILPDTASGSLGMAKAGDTYTVTGRTADSFWLRVCCLNSAPIWLAAQFVDVSGSVESVPIVQP